LCRANPLPFPAIAPAFAPPLHHSKRTRPRRPLARVRFPCLRSCALFWSLRSQMLKDTIKFKTHPKHCAVYFEFLLRTLPAPRSKNQTFCYSVRVKGKQKKSRLHKEQERSALFFCKSTSLQFGRVTDQWHFPRRGHRAGAAPRAGAGVKDHHAMGAVELRPFPPDLTKKFDSHPPSFSFGSYFARAFYCLL